MKKQLDPVQLGQDPNGLKGFTKLYFPLDDELISFPSRDIAVLEYPKRINLSEIAVPVKLAKDYIEKEGDEAYIAGYGPVGHKVDKALQGKLRHSKITMINDCFGTFLICGGNETSRSLPGDSGGPMLIYRNNQWYQIGVSALTGAYDYRSRVSSYCNFIEEVTKNEVKCESIFPGRDNNYLPIKIFEPIYKGQSTSKELFKFVVPLYNYYYNQGCTATVISKRYLLTSAYCVYQDWRADQHNYYGVKITEYLTFKSVIGHLFPDFRSKNDLLDLKNPINVTAYFPSKYKWPWKSNIAVIEFPEGTDFGIKPITLAKDYVQVYLEKEVIVAGYLLGDIKKHIKESPPIMLHSNATVKDFRSSKKQVLLENNRNLKKDEGGPTLIDRNGKFYQIGVNYFSGTPNGSRTMVSKECDFIEEITKNEVQCESIAPIHEQPTTTTSIPTRKRNPQKQESITLIPQALNNASKIGLKLKFLFAVLTLFFL
uniref:Peptidase S1 domain-containing protein n=1 Tax=Panagrolaimus davidi TaxID=227884 RepID=A0A914QC49_9BILA